MKKIILLLLLVFVASGSVTAKVTLKDWMFRGLITNIKEVKKEKNLKNAEKAHLKKAASDEYTEEYDEVSEYDKMINITDPEFEWDQFDGKNSSALMSEHGLLLKNKKNGIISLSTVELPYDTDKDDFTFSIIVFLTGKKIDKDCTLGIVFDYDDNRNYKTILINNSQYSYINVKDGVEYIKKSGLIKLPERTFVMSIKREGDIMYFNIDDIEYAKLANVDIKHIRFGVLAAGKQEVYIPGFLFKIDDKEDSEQSTTPD